ncbi:hypothetical protein EVAR_58940_1 [Eumeta japonica]|uniref:Uncharacterized protein n=1 Tax=Eumeta variegata TaxID=151549 RepID=A0A4C1YI51_EUMVA|nr:hypothetical protein EVAR_58940_1 [Eumeta japonica]
MSVELRSDKQNIYLIGLPSHKINGAKLLSNRQVLTALFYNIREVKLTVSESANIVIRECIIFWEKARIPTKAFPNYVTKLFDLYHVWRELQKNCKKTQVTFKNRENNFVKDLDNLFVIAHVDAFDRMKIEKDKDFLKKPREAGQPGCLGGIDKELAEKEERVRQRRLEEEERKDGKLLPGLDVRSSKEERLPIITSFDDREQLLAVPKLESSSEKHQAKAISTALFDWNLHDKVQIMCCDTTASNTGRFSGACAILEQTLKRELLLFACRHHIYELVLKAVFETKDKNALQDVCLFIVTLYTKPWLECTVAIKAPNQDLCFLKALKEYGKVDAKSSKAFISKFVHHLRDESSDSVKRYIPSKGEITQNFFNMTLDDFVTQRSKQFLSRLQIDDSFLREDVSSWGDNPTFLVARRRISRLKVVNDTAKRAIKLMQDFNGLITAEEEQNSFCCVVFRNIEICIQTVKNYTKEKLP